MHDILRHTFPLHNQKGAGEKRGRGGGGGEGGERKKLVTEHAIDLYCGQDVKEYLEEYSNYICCITKVLEAKFQPSSCAQERGTINTAVQSFVTVVPTWKS